MIDVETIFNAAIDAAVKSKPEIHRFLFNHERKNMVIENLKKQIRETEWKNPLLLNSRIINQLIEDIAKQFMERALEHKKQELMTQGERDLMVKQADKYKRAEEMLQDINKEDTNDGKSFFVTK